MMIKTVKTHYADYQSSIPSHIKVQWNNKFANCLTSLPTV